MRHLTFLSAIATLCVFSSQAQAVLVGGDLININFSDTAYTANTAGSPLTGTSTSAGSWNNLSLDNVNNVTQSFSTSDSSNSISLTVDPGRNSNWSSDDQANTVLFTTGVYSVANLYQKGLTTSSTGQNAAVRIQGLTPGTYEVALVPFFRNMSTDGSNNKVDTATIRIGLGNTTDAVNSGNYTLTSTAATPTENIATGLTTWTNATTGSTQYNYIGTTVTIDSTSRWLSFIIDTNTNNNFGDRAGFSAIQLRMAAIPEPSAFLFGGLICSVLGVNYARKRMQAAKQA